MCGGVLFGELEATESQWLQSDERRGQAYWRRSDRSKKIPFRLISRLSLHSLSKLSLSLDFSSSPFCKE